MADELQFLGGGAYQVARYDRKTGACLNAAATRSDVPVSDGLLSLFSDVRQVLVAKPHISRSEDTGLFLKLRWKSPHATWRIGTTGTDHRSTTAQNAPAPRRCPQT